jgi:hypothetical protein
MASMGPDPQGIRRRHVWEPDPYGLVSPAGLGGLDPPTSSGKGSGAATCHQGGDFWVGLATCPWQKALCGTPAQQPH